MNEFFLFEIILLVGLVRDMEKILWMEHIYSVWCGVFGLARFDGLNFDVMAFSARV